MSRRERRWRPMPALFLTLIAGGVVCGGWKWWERHCYRRTLAQARQDIQAGSPSQAARKLAALSSAMPDSDEVAYLLGSYERARGHSHAAAQAWARIPPGSPFGARAIQGRMELELQRGRLTRAERLIKDAMDDPRSDSSGLLVFLGFVYCQQGRRDEAEQLIEASWGRLDAAGQGRSERAVKLVRLHLQLRLESLPVDAIRAFLDQAAHLAPDDERIWLARANLAIRAGAGEEAEGWLDACLRRHPQDTAVWRARLDWAMATNRIAEVHQTAEHLPAGIMPAAMAAKVAAWLAARRGDARAQRQALECLLTTAPADFHALDCLAQMALRADQPELADQWRRRKADIQQLEARYQKLYQRNQPARDAVEMARLAKRLGQRFEAQAFLTIAVADAPWRADLRRDRDRGCRDPRDTVWPGLTLAEYLANAFEGSHSEPRAGP